MSAATGASKAVAEGWDKMITVTQNRTIICDARGVLRMPRILAAAGQAGGSGYARSGVGDRHHYNADMDKPVPRRQLRRTAWWVAFAALAGFLLADLT
ncbi:hypothetical protein [Cupriavidus oxalaticus]|jgi:hypothetical protein|uniref:Uncharacterized protein n=2 Tax=Cupriavidus oxalaticus TaxID=96344 RepID=A0A5P3VNN5_9BURK|nr:hypothetical protein [Cupriavidus oxalaticus]QEZ47847.1 hypothetical protein D2917_27540 [Cupriavidus oxalaticus]QRQ87823.1 hypothetical protein JTE91_14510 [Cupriavidus oxalaticus]QRQ93850.1 hypothetical protein JTE92_27755 [Cupriavidus oxalaticus]WQD82482.1 hypothetical protein U0036_15500 [Cupriavidus oxalaticus]